ncbi:MAG: DUF4123 domain-containing protein [Gammaproteobacteria bacterium]|nr:DUF4123 domain-containing protein [Gammaproteobacteria bacterium]MCP5425525.1 DUF4123 domain-containing protein [Gammaproteobacteria bacterium]MCP5459355.1 DUF4123 domain-containing protein [Gammaproteobacteria bacterium]
MTNKAPLEALYERLFEVPDATVYAILDGASAPNLPQTLARLGVESVCLFRGELQPDVAQMAPYLAVMQPETPFAEWVLGEGWGRHWGIFAISSADFRSMRKHLRTFLMVYDPSLKPLYFRYYDPRVLRVYLPTCNAEELRTVFGPIRRYIVEDEDPQVLLKFQTDGENLGRESVMLG